MATRVSTSLHLLWFTDRQTPSNIKKNVEVFDIIHCHLYTGPYAAACTCCDILTNEFHRFVFFRRFDWLMLVPQTVLYMNRTVCGPGWRRCGEPEWHRQCERFGRNYGFPQHGERTKALPAEVVFVLTAPLVFSGKQTHMMKMDPADKMLTLSLLHKVTHACFDEPLKILMRELPIQQIFSILHSAEDFSFFIAIRSAVTKVSAPREQVTPSQPCSHLSSGFMTWDYVIVLSCLSFTC